MLEKYLDLKKAEVDEPSVWKISDGSIQITKAGGTESFSFEDEFTIQIGNIDSYIPTSITPVEPEEIEPTQGGGGSEGGGELSGDNPGGDTTGGGDNPGGGTTPSGNGNVTFVLHNTSGQEVRLAGSNYFHISTTGQWTNYVQLPCDSRNPDYIDTWSHWNKNYISIPNGGEHSWSFNVENQYLQGNYKFVSTNKNEISSTNNWPDHIDIPAFIIKARVYKPEKQEYDTSSGMYLVLPLTNTTLESKTYDLYLNKVNPDMTYAPDNITGHYVLLKVGETTI